MSITIRAHSEASRGRRAASVETSLLARTSELAGIETAPFRRLYFGEMGSRSRSPVIGLTAPVPDPTLKLVAAFFVNQREQGLTCKISPQILREQRIVPFPELRGHARGMRRNQQVSEVPER